MGHWRPRLWTTIQNSRRRQWRDWARRQRGPWEPRRLDWDRLLTQARIFEWSSAVSAALSQTVALFETPVPQTVLGELSHRADRNTERVAALRDQPATHTLEELQKLRSLNWRARLSLLLALVAPSPAYMRWRYGLKTGRALPAWYLYRWWGIFKDMLHTAVAVAGKTILPSGRPNAIAQDVPVRASNKPSSF